MHYFLDTVICSEAWQALISLFVLRVLGVKLFWFYLVARLKVKMNFREKQF